MIIVSPQPSDKLGLEDAFAHILGNYNQFYQYVSSACNIIFIQDGGAQLIQVLLNEEITTSFYLAFSSKPLLTKILHRCP